MNAIIRTLPQLTIALALVPLAPAQAAEPASPTPVHYEASTQSLSKAAIPEWFIDAKLGIFMHWGPESIPGVASTWYARWMYEQGSEGYKYHCATYGHPSKFGYKDLCKLFTAPKFDQAQADRLVKLYKQAGARYVVPVASHHDNFDMWDSKFQPRWNSMATAGKDVCGMWQQATVANGLHFGVASHVARSFRWLQTSHGADKAGPLAGVPYDGQDPAFADLYGVPWKSSDPGYEGPQDVGPPEFEKNFKDRMFDLIDRYHPDLYYTDGGPPFKTAGYEIVSHLYNQSMALHGGKLQAVANFKGGCPIGAENFEFEFPATLQKNVWQTDKTMGAEWYWLRDRHKDYKKGREIVHTLIDVVSKNGNLLLNVPLTGDGELEEEVITMLKVMAHDFDRIGEAIFATRPWEAFGEGQQNFNGISSASAADLRFTRNKTNTVLYVTPLGWPGDGAVLTVKTLGKNRIDLKSLESVSLLGTTARLKFSQDAEALRVTLPAKPPYECNAYPLKLTFPGKIPKLKPAAKLLWQALARDIEGTEDRAAYGLNANGGVLMLDVPAGSDAAKAGLKKDDVIVTCDGKEVMSIAEISAMANQAAGRKLALAINRQQKLLAVDLSDHVYVVMETQADLGFKDVPVAAAAMPAKVSSGGPATRDGPLDALIDGKVAKDSGPIFANGVDNGMYKLDLAAAKSVGRINTFSSSGRHRAKQNFVLYGSNAATDPGWEVADTAAFSPIAAVDTRQSEPKEYVATSLRRSDGRPLGTYRWLVWAVFPVNGEIGGENSAYQELQVIPAE
ncbi:MAG: alpha-L-fucosidase [Akkermansiaceae bacterium]|nr:alpha-L-fucosidase [Akkermansiaceae bacterium]